jgi:hypothetical protein
MASVPYSEEQIEKMEEMLDEWRDRADAMTTQLFVRRYRHPGTREAIVHGFYRRLDTLIYCIEKVFSDLPPQAELAGRSLVKDITIVIQSF